MQLVRPSSGRLPNEDAAGSRGRRGPLIDGRTDPKVQSAGAKAAASSRRGQRHGALDMEGRRSLEGPITALSSPPAICRHSPVRPRLTAVACMTSRLDGTVFVALDWDEAGRRAPRQDDACRALANGGARPYRLALPAGSGDWNDRLRAVGLATMRAELRAVTSDVHPFDRRNHASGRCQRCRHDKTRHVDLTVPAQPVSCAEDLGASDYCQKARPQRRRHRGADDEGGRAPTTRSGAESVE